MVNKQTVNSLIRGVNILKSISKGNYRIGEILDDLNLSKGTTHRLLKTLTEVNFVSQDPLSLKYYLGPAILELLSDPMLNHNVLIICASEPMQALRDISNETILLHVRAGLQRVCLEELESHENIKYTNGKGFFAPLYVGAAGKILLASLEDKEINQLLENIDFTPITENTITDLKKLFSEIYKVRSQGYALSFGERVAGSSCASVLVKNYVMPAALSILGPSNRFTRQKIIDLLPKVRESAEKISIKLKKIRTESRK